MDSALVASQAVAEGARGQTCRALGRQCRGQARNRHGAYVARAHAEFPPEGSAERGSIGKTEELGDLADRAPTAGIAKHRKAFRKAKALNVTGDPAFVREQTIELR